LVICIFSDKSAKHTIVQNFFLYIEHLISIKQTGEISVHSISRRNSFFSHLQKCLILVLTNRTSFLLLTLTC